MGTVTIALLKSFIASPLLPLAGRAQNLSYSESNHSSQAQPDLTHQTVKTINLTFSDCMNGPLSTICNHLPAI